MSDRISTDLPGQRKAWWTRPSGPIICLATLLFSLLSSCTASQTTLEGSATSVASPSRLPAQAFVPSPVDSTVVQQPALDDEIDLVIWAPAFLSPKTEKRSGAILADTFARFEETHPGLQIRTVLKAESGRSGLFAYLRTASQAAPDILPDIIALDSHELWQAAEMELIPPLTSEEVAPFETIYPVALNTARRHDGGVYGLPYALDLEHLVYHVPQVPTPPATWGELLSQNRRYLFAAGSTDGYSGDFLLSQYVAAGGKLEADGSLTDPNALLAVFQFMQAGRQQGLIPDSALNLANAEAVWSSFNHSDINMANVPASLYGENRTGLSDVSYGYAPTRNGKPAAIVHTWSFAVVTTDPQRRQLALELLVSLFDPAVQGQWSRSAHWLPTQPEGWAAWDTNDPYQDFLQDNLETAISLPNSHPFADFVRELQQAQRGLLNGELSPQQAVEELRNEP